jgi:ubiquinone/menaquinone biosynthesis C-methylase UbiE
LKLEVGEVEDLYTANRRIYSVPEVAAHYATLEYLTPCERSLFDRYVTPRMAVLDIGVGGGRTTPYLSQHSSRYVGVDYSEEMVESCRKKFPRLEFRVADASKLTEFQDASFDVVVMSFNTIDYLLPDEKRRKCLEECRRVLRNGGVLIFSSHNPLSILVRPAWNRARLRTIAGNMLSPQSRFFQPFVSLLSVAKAAHSWGRAFAASAARIFRRIPRPMFWRGEGYLFDSVHGGLMTHYSTPARVVAELAQFDFQMTAQLGDDYPRPSRTFMTDWYYYVFSKNSHESVRGEACA